MVHAKDPPSHYLNKLRTYLDPKASRSHRVSIWIFYESLNLIVYLFGKVFIEEWVIKLWNIGNMCRFIDLYDNFNVI